MNKMKPITEFLLSKSKKLKVDYNDIKLEFDDDIRKMVTDINEDNDYVFVEFANLNLLYLTTGIVFVWSPKVGRIWRTNFISKTKNKGFWWLLYDDVQTIETAGQKINEYILENNETID